MSPQEQTSGMTSPSRRQVLKLLGSGALVAASAPLSVRRAFAASPAAPAVPAPAAASPVAPLLQPFAITDVELHDGPFVDAQKRNEDYLLRLEAGRMLHNFRVNAGLEPKAPIYGGWESVGTWTSIRAHGHTLGHYLSAASMMVASTGHDEIKKRVDYILTELKECQDAGKTGLVCAFPDNDAQVLSLVQRGRCTARPLGTPCIRFSPASATQYSSAPAAISPKISWVKLCRLGRQRHSRHDR